jgi:heterodisulfide reductase subunit B
LIGRKNWRRRHENAFLPGLLHAAQLEEVRDWNCCGATEYMSVHRVAAHALVGRNLALASRQAEKQDTPPTLTAACSACYLNLAKTDRQMREDPRLKSSVNEALGAGGLEYAPGSLKVRHLLDVVCNDVGYEAIRSKVVKPLYGLKVAPYYGCQVVRPDPDARWDDHEHPVAMDRLLQALGAEVVDYPLKTQCCGGHMTVIGPEVAYGLIRRLVHGAQEAGAHLIATLCPMCQINLDAYQVEMNKHFHSHYHVPVLYFTQLMGLAFGKPPEELGIGKEFVDAAEALTNIQAKAPEAAKARPKRRPRAEDGLPMPRME